MAINTFNIFVIKNCDFVIIITDERCKMLRLGKVPCLLASDQLFARPHLAPRKKYLVASHSIDELKTDLPFFPDSRASVFGITRCFYLSPTLRIKFSPAGSDSSNPS